MARIRTIKPEFFTDEEVAAMSPLARIAYEGLWCHADREGRLKDRPVRLKAQILPYDDVDMIAILDEIEQHKFIRRYVVDGIALIHVRTLVKHQQIPSREPESVLPAPPDDEKHVPSTAQTVLEHVPSTGEGKGKEGNGKGTEESAEPHRDSPPPTVLMTFPTVGTGAKSWDLTTDHIAEWQPAYLGMDLVGECRKALVWVKANQPKTARGMPAFLTRWFNREVDRRGRVAPPPAGRKLEHNGLTARTNEVLRGLGRVP